MDDSFFVFTSYLIAGIVIYQFSISHFGFYPVHQFRFGFPTAFKNYTDNTVKNLDVRYTNFDTGIPVFRAVLLTVSGKYFFYRYNRYFSMSLKP